MPRWQIAACALVVCTCVRAQVAVEEDETRARLVNGFTTVAVAIRNFAAKSFEGRVDLEWLDTAGAERNKGFALATFPPGRSVVDIPLRIPTPAKPLFYRLRYRVMPGAANLAGFAPHEGILSFPAIAEHAFVLSATGIGQPRVGQPYELRVFAMHPVTGKPVAGVDVTVGDQDATTNLNGEALVRLIPDDDEWDEPHSVTLMGRLGDCVYSTDQELPEVPRASVRIDLDKPIYQPGQTMHVRLMAIGRDGRTRASAPHSVHIRDETRAVIHAAELETSRFGIASTDWEIPANAVAGKYSIEVEEEDSDRAYREVEIRKYELPSFRVSVQPDRAFYLPGQKANIEIRADYLFGKPVAAAKVRITEADEDEALQEGTMDGSARFHGVIELGEAADSIAGLHKDVQYTAYVTDATTNRTEQRRFDLRVSRDPIHVYVVRAGYSEKPRPAYFSAYTPDGKPLQCDIEILSDGKRLARGRTNRFGLARIYVALPDDDIIVRARAADGTVAETKHHINGEAKHVWIDTDRALYRAGQPIQCDITSDRPDLHVMLLAWDQNRVLLSRSVQLQSGHARATIPYDPRCSREVSVGVVSSRGREYQDGTKVLYPGPEDLRVSAHAAATYRPGEQATVALQVATAAKTPVEAAFGIAVVDESVFERAETDRALGRRRWFDFFQARETNLGGVTWRGLLDLDPKAIDEDLELVAEALREEAILFYGYSDFLTEEREAFQRLASKPLEGISQLLNEQYFTSLNYPTNQTELDRVAAYQLGIALDPWGQPYRAEFSIEGANHVLRFMSAGPDKKFGTEDDLEAMTVRREWFAPVKALIEPALDREKDYPATPYAFAATLAGVGLNFGALRDPWGNQLRAEIKHRARNRMVSIESPGPDHKFGTADDAVIATWLGTFFRTRTEAIEEILVSAEAFPTNADEFYRVLDRGGVDLRSERDPWGHSYSIEFSTGSRFTDVVEMYTYSDYNETAQTRKQITPAKQKYLQILLKSLGEDGIQGTYDDFVAAEFGKFLEENKALPAASAAKTQAPQSVEGTGSITGLVTDPSGGVISKAEVVLNDTYKTETDDQGRYRYLSVPPGTYTLRFSSQGFQAHLMGRVPVRAGHMTRADVVLQVGAVSSSVEVQAEVRMVETSNASMVAFAPAAATSTPRVREYFPETLLWQPELVSDSAGRARLNFKLADSITTWRVAVIASTEDGRISETETEVRAFKPFFADLDPPQVLTVGDEIALPVPIRNYLTTDESVSVTVASPASLAVLDAPKQPVRIAASSSASPLIRMRAAAAPADVKLRVTARAKSAGDAIEKPVSIHPDGEPILQSVTDLLNNGGVLRLDVPANAIPGSLHAQLKFYPTLLAHVIESMESILHKPYGCGEQTISSSYPNLLFLKMLKTADLKHERLEARARHNLESGYKRLLGYQKEDGGFSYWAHSEPDTSLTAYAVEFLEDAKEFISVEKSVADRARDWLRGQKSDESLSVRSMSLRATFVAGADDREIIARLGELAQAAAKIDDPYAIAEFALAAMEANRPELARSSIDRLRGLAHTQSNGVYWDLQTNTPFHGWGRAGRIETSALALTALTRWYKHDPSDPELQSLINQGVLFLLRSKDESGLWLTSQATVRVFTALLAGMTQSDSKHFTAQISVNGVVAASVLVPGGDTIQGPVTLDISRFVKSGIANEVSISTPPVHGATQAYFGMSWYQPWAGVRKSDELQMSAYFSTRETEPGEPVICDVSISRPAWRGYGMVIAEIGLPPGAEVDRGALQELRNDYRMGVDSAEVAPDRVVFYVWPRANDTKFQFIFRPRYPIRALNAPSVLYDYYNPDARVVLPPEKFVVTGK